MKIKVVTTGKEAQEKIENGINQIYEVAAAAYGAKGGNVLLEREYGDPTLSRDGVTNVNEVFLPDRTENMAGRVLVQASKRSNETVGDGTTAAVILTKHFYDRAKALIASGVYDRMTISEKLESLILPIHQQLEKISVKYDMKNITDVAVVSAGNEAIGQLIADTITEVGLDGGVVVERHPGNGIFNQITDGFYFNKGFTNAWLINNRAQLRAEHTDVSLLITEKTLSSVHEMAGILDQCIGQNITRIVIVGDVTSDAMGLLVQQQLQGKLDITVVEPPVVAGNRSLFLEDLAVFTGGKVFTEGMTAESFDTEMLGKAQKVVINEFSTSIVGGAGDPKAIKSRIKQLRADLKQATDGRTVEAIQERLGKLAGKIGIIRVGGATPIDADHTKLRVDDAVCAVRSAMRSGVVPGGGIALLRCRDVAGEFASALEQPFKQLFSNAEANAERYFAMADVAPIWSGFDLKNLTDKPTNLLKAGIVDPLEVIKEVVTNAATTASSLITTTVGVVHKDERADTPGNN